MRTYFCFRVLVYIDRFVFEIFQINVSILRHVVAVLVFSTLIEEKFSEPARVVGAAGSTLERTGYLCVAAASVAAAKTAAAGAQISEAQL